jgi:hypothetical protein
MIEGSGSESVPRTYGSGSRIRNTFHKIIYIEHNKTVFREFNARFKPFRDAQPSADKDSDAVSVRSVSTTASTIGRGAHTLLFILLKTPYIFYINVPVCRVPSVGVSTAFPVVYRIV